MTEFYVVNCEKYGDIFEILVTNNRIRAEETLKAEAARLSERDALRSRLYIDIWQAKDLSREYSDIGIEAHPTAEEWDQLADDFEIIDEIF